MRIAPVVEFTESDQAWIARQARSRIAPKRLGERCQIVLLAAAGKTNQQIAAVLGISRQKAGRWRLRFVEKGRRGIEEEEPGRGRKPIYLKPLRDLIVRKIDAKPIKGRRRDLKKIDATLGDLRELIGHKASR